MDPRSFPAVLRRGGWLLVVVALSLALAPAPAATAKPVPVPASFGWGYNNRGTLGNGTSARVKTPSLVQFPVSFTSIEAGRDHTVAIDTKGRVWAWGRNDHGQLGDGTVQERLRPTRVKLPSGTRVTQVAVAEDHALALTSTGRVYAWGANSYGQLGDGSRRERHAPVRVSIGRASQLGAGRQSSYAALAHGGLRAWGHNEHGQLGDRSRRNRHRPVPVSLRKGTRIAEVDAGDATAVALTSTGAVLAWGDNHTGMVGVTGRSDRRHPVKVRLPGGAKARAVGAGSQFAAALSKKGQVVTWGGATGAELGRDATSHSKPGNVSLERPVRQISVGGAHLMALTADGQVWTWGQNNTSQLGDGQDQPRAVPVRVKLPAGYPVTAVSAGTFSSFALTSRKARTSRLTITPADVSVRSGQKVTYTVSRVDGHSRPVEVPDARLEIDGDGTCTGLTCSATSTGRHTVTASRDGMRATALLNVTSNSSTPASPTSPGAPTASPSHTRSGPSSSNPTRPGGGAAPPGAEPSSPFHRLLAQTGASLWLSVFAALGVLAGLSGTTLLVVNRRHRNRLRGSHQ